ncbi:MAG: hypothetical protein FJ288_17340 [Planctomycetes bacterium]|nr:hypothetical protein [Planctomycetota bacterium]
MADELKRLILPELYTHFNQPANKERLRMVAWWGHSFEPWLKFEVVFALEPLMQRMTGDPWEYEAWDMEQRRPGLGRVDIVFGGRRPLCVQLKVCAPCWGYKPKFCAGPNSLLEDIENVRAYRREAAACLLFTLEHAGSEMVFEEIGLPPPEGDHKGRIELGESWCDACWWRSERTAKEQPMWARFYYWTNGL